MNEYQRELTKIKELIKSNPDGLTITEMHKISGISKNTLAKYLDIMLFTGHVKMKNIGMAKLYSLSTRVPVSAMLSFSSDMIVVLDAELKVIDANEKYLDFTGQTKQEVKERLIRGLAGAEISEATFIANIKEGTQSEKVIPEFKVQKSGKKYYFKLKIIPTVLDDANSGVTLLFEDTTIQTEVRKQILIQRDLGLSLSTVTSIKDALPLCVETAMKISEMDCGAIYLIDTESKELYPAFVTGLSDKLIEKLSKCDFDSDVAKQIIGKKPLYTTYDKGSFPLYEEDLDEGLRAFAVIPAYNYEDLVGYLLISSHTLSEVPENSRGLLEGIAAQTGNAIAKLQVEDALKDALVQSEERYHTLLDISPVAVGIHSKGKIKYINPAGVKMLGAKSQDEITSREVNDFIAPESMDLIKKRIYDSYVYNKPAPFTEITLKRISGEEFNAETATTPITDKKKPHTLFIMRDITEKKFAEEKIKNLNQLLFAHRKVIHMITHENDLNRILESGCRTLVEANKNYNACWVALFDINGNLENTAEIGIGDKFDEIVANLKKGKLPKCVQETIVNSSTISTTNPLLECSDECPLAGLAEHKGVITTALKYNHKIYGIISISRSTDTEPDIKEKELFQELADEIAFALYNQEREEDLKASYQQLLEILDFLPQPGFAINRNREVIAWNKEMEKLSSFPKETMLGKGDYEYSVPFYGEKRPMLVDIAISPNDLDIEKYYSSVKKEGPRYSVELFMPRVYGGKGAHIVSTSIPFFDSEGRVSGGIEMMSDISENVSEREQLIKNTLAIESSANPIIYSDLDDNISYMNQAALRLTGYDNVSELKGKPAKKLWKESLVRKVMTNETLLEKGGINAEMDIYKKNGDKVKVLVSETIVTDTDGRPVMRMTTCFTGV